MAVGAAPLPAWFTAAKAFIMPAPAQPAPALGLSPGSSPSGVAVPVRMLRTCSTVSAGLRESMSPTTPDTNGAENEVPAALLVALVLRHGREPDRVGTARSIGLGAALAFRFRLPRVLEDA